MNILVKKEIEDIAESLALETHKILNSRFTDCNLQYALTIKYLEEFLFYQVLGSLDRYAKLGDVSKAMEFTSREFSQTKLGVQKAVADAFYKAVREFSGKKLDYSCIITTKVDKNSRLIC